MSCYSINLFQCSHNIWCQLISLLINVMICCSYILRVYHHFIFSIESNTDICSIFKLTIVHIPVIRCPISFHVVNNVFPRCYINPKLRIRPIFFIFLPDISFHFGIFVRCCGKNEQFQFWFKGHSLFYFSTNLCLCQFCMCIVILTLALNTTIALILLYVSIHIHTMLVLPLPAMLFDGIFAVPYLTPQ